MQDTKIKKTDSARKFRRVLSASTLAGDRVRNAAGDDLGKVDELMVDIPSGRIAYAVLSFGGFLGMGNKLFAVPGFDKDNWPDMADNVWGSEIFRYYHTTPYWEDETTSRRSLRGGGGLGL